MSPLRRTALAVVLLTVVLAAPPAIPRAFSSNEMTPGIPWTGAVAVKRSVSQLMSTRAAQYTLAAEPKMAERYKIRPDRTNLPQSPDAVDQAQWPPAVDGLGTSSAAITTGPQTPSTTFVGATLFGAHPTFSFPADVMGDVGPTQFVVFVNGRIAS